MSSTASEPRERFIPFRRSDVVERCARDARLDPEDRDTFRRVCVLLESLVHHEFRRRLEVLKDCYLPFDPSRATRVVHDTTAEQRRDLQQRLVAELRAVLDDANFEPVGEEELRDALGRESLFRVRLEVDFDDFEEVLLFRRGAEHRTETIRTWGGLRRSEIEFVNYERVLVFVKLKDRAHFEAKGRDDLPFEPGSTIVKLFHSVPRADLEMLFPNTEIRMRTTDKLAIGVPAVVGGIAVVFTKLLTSVGFLVVLFAFWLGLRRQSPAIDEASLVALGIGLAGVGGFLVRQVNKFKNRKVRFMKALSENLYFKNLDNDAGVFFHLLDAAEEEETKEAVLAYFFLATAPGPLTRGELDREVERWFEEHLGCALDFEVDDGIAKLVRLGLVEHDGHRWRAEPFREALRRLDRRWDDCFREVPDPTDPDRADSDPDRATSQ